MDIISIGSISEYDGLMASGGRFSSWAFRGQADAGWSVHSSLSRHLTSFNVSAPIWPKQEARIIRVFKRKAHLYLNHVPGDEDDFQWLSLIQHYGGPTRLLDFTWSPYVAAYFALELARGDSAVFAVDTSRIGKASVFSDLRTPGLFQSDYLPGTNRILTYGEPALLNRRITAQHGTFLVPGVLDLALEQLIDEVVGGDAIVKVVLSQAMRSDAMRALYKRCVENATLFPDLNGLAASLRYELEHHWAYDAATGTEKSGFIDSPYARTSSTRIFEVPGP